MADNPLPTEEGTENVNQRNNPRPRFVGAGGKGGNSGVYSRLDRAVNNSSKQISNAAKTFRRRPQDFLIPPYPFEDLAALMESNPTHYACVLSKAAAISGIGWQVCPNLNEARINSEAVRLAQASSRSGVEEKELTDLLEKVAVLEAQKEILEEFFTHPNPTDTFAEINMRTDMDLHAIGNAFWEVVRDLSGQPTGIFHMPVITCRLLVNRTGVAQVRAPSYPLQPVVRPSQDDFGPYLVYFKFFGDPWIMDWHTGKIHGVMVKTEQVRAFQSANHDRDGNPLYGEAEYEPGMDPSPEGMTLLWRLHAGRPEPLPPDSWANEVLWWKRYSVKWADGYGVPDIIAALAACAGDQGAHRHQLDFFENFAVPRMIINLKGFQPGDPDDEDDPLLKLRNFLDLEIRGQAHKTAILESPPDLVDPQTGTRQSGGDIQVEKLSTEVNDASFLSYMKHNRDEIIRAERVPLEMIASLDQPVRPTATGVSLGLEVFKSFVVRPEQMVREERVNKLIQQGFGFDWRFEFLQIDNLDELREMEIASGYYKINTWTINQIRSKLGDDPIAGGDRPFILSPLGLVFIDELEKMSTSQLSQTPNNPLSAAGQGAPTGRGNKSPGSENVKQNPGSGKDRGVRHPMSRTEDAAFPDFLAAYPQFASDLLPPPTDSFSSNNNSVDHEKHGNPEMIESLSFVPLSLSFGVDTRRKSGSKRF